MDNKEGNNIVIRSSVAGSVFPHSEKDTVFPVLVDGSDSPVQIEGALYGRAVELRGDVKVGGPVVVRGDARLNPLKGRIQLGSGITVNGTLNGVEGSSVQTKTIHDDIQNAAILIKGDISVNQNISLKNTIVFGSLRAVNCSLENSLVLGTCIVEESLKVTMSSVGGYASRDITFAGNCLLLHALGESRSKPIFVPHEMADGQIIGCDIRYYPAVRGANSLTNRLWSGRDTYPPYSQLFDHADWVCAQATPNEALDEGSEQALTKWVLSIGGRIGDFSRISQAVSGLTQMLKCGFEYEHYHVGQRAELLKTALFGLTEEEQWILKTVCS